MTEELRQDYAPWAFWESASAAQRADQAARADELRGRGYLIGEGCVVSRLAAVHPETLTLGDRSYVAAHAHVTGDVVLGADCSVNVSAAVRGRVRMGRAVRIGAHTSILGFEHGLADLEQDLFRQPLTSAGVTIGDDVWIGSHVVVVDGVHIGSHAVVGAGAVVTRDVPDWAVAVGNPARPVRDRRATGSASGEPGALAARLRAFVERARSELPAILDAAWIDAVYRDSPSAVPTVRAHCDAIELAALLLGEPPAQLDARSHVARLRALQDARTGLVDELADGRWPALAPTPAALDRSTAVTAPAATPDPGPRLPDHPRAYHVLSVGYALDLLGSAFAHPVRAVTELSPQVLARLLDELPWRQGAWGAGALVDAVGTALTWAVRGGHPVPDGLIEVVIGWLAAHRDPASGLWGSPEDGLLEPVNGTYRAVRGTIAAWGVPLGGEDLLIDTVLRRAAGVTRSPGMTACDALDVVHLLWWAARTRPDYRGPEIAAVATAVLNTVLTAWVPGLGLPFAPGRAPSLQGTEMWLAIEWYAADLLGQAEALGYHPRGVHRPEAALRLGPPR